MSGNEDGHDDDVAAAAAIGAPSGSIDDLAGGRVGARISVGERPPPSVAELLASIADKARRQELERQWRRDKAAAEIAHYRWEIAQEIHRLEDGVSKLDFRRRPFQPTVYQDPSPDLVLYGSAQGPGKTEWMICDMAASAAWGLKVLVVISTKPKRDRFVASRLNPCFAGVGTYAQMIASAKSRGADADSTQLKHFGWGWINLISSTVKRDFTSYPTDKAVTDEHQECEQDNLKLLDDRLSASSYGFQVRIGHPTTHGNEANDNLDWLYQNSDRRVWKVPCPTCGLSQEMGWWTHVIFEKRNKGGAIVDLRPRDPEYKKGGRLDMRPVCQGCHRPMNRLADVEDGAGWEAQNPGPERHGYKFSNLYNSDKRLDVMFGRYSRARFSPRDTQEFVNKQLGEPWSMDGSKINDPMLAGCASGEGTGVPPYRFMPASHFDWRPLLQAGN